MNEPRGVANQSVSAMYSKNSRRAAKRKKNRASNQGQPNPNLQPVVVIPTYPSIPPPRPSIPPQQIIQNKQQNEKPTQPPPKARKVDKISRLTDNVFVPRYTFDDFGGCEEQLLVRFIY